MSAGTTPMEYRLLPRSPAWTRAARLYGRIPMLVVEVVALGQLRPRSAGGCWMRPPRRGWNSVRVHRLQRFRVYGALTALIPSRGCWPRRFIVFRVAFLTGRAGKTAVRRSWDW